MQKPQTIEEIAVNALGLFASLREGLDTERALLSAALCADFADWLAAAHAAGPLAIHTVEAANPLRRRLCTEVEALGGPFVTYCEEGEIYAASGTPDGDRLDKVATCCGQYLFHASRVIHAIQAEAVIARMRKSLVES